MYGVLLAALDEVKPAAPPDLRARPPLFRYSEDEAFLALLQSFARWRDLQSESSVSFSLTMEGRSYDIRPESFKADMAMSGLCSAAGTVHVEARRLSADCVGAR